VFEFGPVTFPANPNATAGMRSATDAYMEHLARADERTYAQVARAVRSLRPAVARRRVPPDGRIARALSPEETSTLSALLSRLAAADAAFDPFVDLLVASDEALDDALATISDLLGVDNPDSDADEGEDEADLGRTNDFTGDSTTRSGERGEHNPAEDPAGSTTRDAQEEPSTPGHGTAAAALHDLSLRQRSLWLAAQGIIPAPKE